MTLDCLEVRAIECTYHDRAQNATCSLAKLPVAFALKVAANLIIKGRNFIRAPE